MGLEERASKEILSNLHVNAGPFLNAAYNLYQALCALVTAPSTLGFILSGDV